MFGALAKIAAMGLLQQIFVGSESVILQVAVPDRLGGRVMAAQSIIFISVAPLGVFAIGALGTVIGTSDAYVAAGLTTLVVVLVSIGRLDVLRGLRMSLYTQDLGLSGAGAPLPSR